MEFVNCCNCGRDDTSLLFTKWNHQVVRCRHCGLVYVNPRGVSIESDEYFRGAYLETIEENGRLKQGIEGIYSEVLRNLSAHLMPGRLLDIGCAMGHFMEYARRHGWNVHGVECSPYAASYGRNRWGLPIQAVVRWWRSSNICRIQDRPSHKRSGFLNLAG